MNFQAEKLKKCRKELMTQQKFSEEIGVSFEHYSKIENSYNKPSVPVFLKICHTLKKPAQYFFSEKPMFLTNKQIEILMSYDNKKLELILNLVKNLYI